MAIDKKQYLDTVLETHKMSHIDSKVQKFRDKKDEIKDALVEKYGNEIYTIINSGSYAKHTAINTKFDLDIVVPFKRKSFDTIEGMFADIFDFLSDKYKDETKEVKKQKVSTGIYFKADEDGDMIDIDVVPGREITEDTYPESNDLNIYFNEDYWGFKKGTYTKTNIQAQIAHIRDTGDKRSNARKIIRLLKIWKSSKTEPYKSFFLELATIKAFNNTKIEGDIWDMLKAVMEYIRDNVSKESFTLIDPGNSNNDVANSMDSSGKVSLSNKLDTILTNIDNNSKNIEYYFPINEEFKQEDSEDNKYEIKDPVIAPSIPPNSERFG